MRCFPVIPLLIALAAPVMAAEKETGSKNAATKDAGGKPGTNVDMPFLMAPMTGADGKLSGYAYISTRLTATSDVNALGVREKLAFIQDAFVRDVNGNSVAKSDDPAAVDQALLQNRLLDDAKQVM